MILLVCIQLSLYQKYNLNHHVKFINKVIKGEQERGEKKMAGNKEDNTKSIPPTER